MNRPSTASARARAARPRVIGETHGCRLPSLRPTEAGIVVLPPLFRAFLSATVLALTLVAAPAAAQLELNYQYGSILNPFSGSSEPTHIFTLQHAGGWRAGGSFFFLDYSTDGVADEFNFNDRDLYGEWYPTLSLGSLSEGGVGFGPVSDVRLVAGVNLGIQSKVVKYVPGVELGWNIPGFIFVSTILGGFIDASSGLEAGGAPSTDDSFNFDVAWLSVFQLGSQSFSFTGHAEYMGAITDELGNDYPGSILAQPQLRWDLGQALTGAAGVLHVGVEYQLWTNKLGTTRDESVVQLLVVWQLD